MSEPKPQAEISDREFARALGAWRRRAGRWPELAELLSSVRDAAVYGEVTGRMAPETARLLRERVERLVLPCTEDGMHEGEAWSCDLHARHEGPHHDSKKGFWTHRGRGNRRRVEPMDPSPAQPLAPEDRPRPRRPAGSKNRYRIQFSPEQARRVSVTSSGQSGPPAHIRPEPAAPAPGATRGTR